MAVSPGWRGVQSSIGVASSWKNRLGLIAETLLARGEQIVPSTSSEPDLPMFHYHFRSPSKVAIFMSVLELTSQSSSSPPILIFHHHHNYHHHLP